MMDRRFLQIAIIRVRFLTCALFQGFVCALTITALVMMGPQESEAASDVAEALQRDVVEIAKRSKGAVVHIRVKSTAPRDASLEELLRAHNIQGRMGGTPGLSEMTGSGVIVSPEGRVLTNQHVVGGTLEVVVVLGDQRTLPGVVIGADPRTDVAVVQILVPGTYPHLNLANSDDVNVGDFAIAVGSPFNFQSTFTFGIVSAIGRRGLSGREIQDYIQTDAAVNPGNSGGPLLNLDGDVIGINTAIYSPAIEQNSGISFAIPSNMVARIVKDLISLGRVRRPWVGVEAVASSGPNPEEGASARGVELVRVVGNSPADRAGLRRGDIVTAVNNEPTPTVNAFRAYLMSRRVQEENSFALLRGEETLFLDVVSEEQRDLHVPLEKLPAKFDSWAGTSIVDLDGEWASRFGAAATSGVIVVRVEKNSPGARLGLLPGDVIVAVGGEPVRSCDELSVRLRSAAGGWAVVGLERGLRKIAAVLPVESFWGGNFAD